MEQWQGLRITTWNVNGIRNPFGYQPWRQDRTFAAMFEILQADIVVMQETKIQRKDLQDDMVLVPGWDVYFSLPKHKKGYSGVAIYTRNSVCAPIRAEEGLTGILTPPNSTTSFFDLPKDQQIGGYPSLSQLLDSSIDAATLDSEGRCVILEFPAFVLIGTYCPANRDETRDDFRVGFLNVLDHRVRNLVAAGKRVFLTGDLNIIRQEIDTANAEEKLRKHGVTIEEYLSTPARRMLNQLLVDGKVIGERDEGKEQGVMIDICRSFHPTRKGMFTCWEQKINARPGNFGSRIDYVLCSKEWKDWFSESNIQEGLMGSDHCPVYAVIKQKVDIEGKGIVDIRDIMSDGMFKDGVRQREWSTKDLLPLSAKLIPEFDRRRSIRDMFTKQPLMRKDNSSLDTSNFEINNLTERFVLQGEGKSDDITDEVIVDTPTSINGEVTLGMLQDDSQTSTLSNSTSVGSLDPTRAMPSPAKPAPKRPSETSSSINRPQKRGKSGPVLKTAIGAKGQPGKGQSSLMGFFKPKASPQLDSSAESQWNADVDSDTVSIAAASDPPTPARSIAESVSFSEGSDILSPSKKFDPADQKDVIDPIVAKESWSKLLGKRVVPRCEHNEPCISLVTRKPGVNCGRSFYICPRPLGPTGQKERNSQWRCGTFIWSSDWTGDDS